MKRIFIEMFLLTPEENIELARKYNVGVELFIKTHILIKLTTKQIKKWKMNLKDVNGVSIHGPYKDLVLGSIDPLIREVVLKRYLQALKIASMLNAEWMVIHLNFDEHVYGQAKTREKWIKNAVSLLNKLLNKEVLILLENTKERDPELFVKIFNSLDNDYIGMCLDVGHAFAFSDKNLHEWIVKVSKYIKEVHLHESIKGVDAHLPLGSGHIDINKVLSEIENETSGDFVITLEPRNEKELHQNLRWLKNNGWI